MDLSQPVSLHSTWQQVAGRRMHAWTSPGSPTDATPVVLVHGLGVSGTYLLPTAERLALDHPVYVPDLPGFGRSDKPPRPLDIPELADALAAWLRMAGPERATFVGNSLGCQTIVDFAVRYPEHIDRAVLIGSTLDSAAHTFFGQVARGTLDLLFEPPNFWPILLKDYLTAGPMRTARTLLYALRDPLEEKLRRIEVPVLVVRGERDPIAPQRWVERMAHLLPRGEVAVIPHAAHVANYSAPEAVARLVRTFMQRPNVALAGPAQTAS